MVVLENLHLGDMQIWLVRDSDRPAVHVQVDVHEALVSLERIQPI